ncbi:MAG TPA: NYN domain-containing protein [Jatrophihabitans sp.]|nr:NYN domain-containing protein [Jatrophihabitans sp.]
MTDAGADAATDAGADAAQPALPAAVRQQLVSIAAELMSRTPVSELPGSVRRFARFAPAKRLRLGASEIAAALAVEPGFRDAVAEVVAQSSPELVGQVSAGSPPSTADPVDVAVIAYLLRPPGWQRLLADIAERLAGEGQRRAIDAEQDRLRAELDRLAELVETLTRDRDQARTAGRSAAAAQAEQLAELRQRLRTGQAELRAARREVEQLAAERDRLRAELDRRAAGEAVELRRARARIAALEGEQEAGRRSQRAAREHDEARLWVLLETITAAATGLRRELALTEPGNRPADAVTAGQDQAAAGRPWTVDGSLLQRLLDGPHVHLIVDGYNLTKTGYGTLPLADQRSRLVSSLGPLAARTGIEVTVAFDGTAAPVGAAASGSTPRGVRVLFSAPGQLADDLIRALLRAEPAGRTVVVASSDQAVAASARAAGGWSTTAEVLLGRLERS